MISETKIDDSFPFAHFLIEGFCTPYRFDRNSKGGDILLYDRKYIPSNLITVQRAIILNKTCVTINA